MRRLYSLIFVLMLTPSAFSLPIYIGIDTEPANKSSNTSGGVTYVYEEACIEAGEITEIQVFTHDVGGGTIDFAVFDKAGSNFTDDEYVEGLTLAAGLNTYTAPADFTAMPIDVDQYIGFYAGVTGRLERHDPSGAGYWYDSGDQIGDGTVSTFTLIADKDIQIRMKITAIASTESKKVGVGDLGDGKW